MSSHGPEKPMIRIKTVSTSNQSVKISLRSRMFQICSSEYVTATVIHDVSFQDKKKQGHAVNH